MYRNTIDLESEKSLPDESREQHASSGYYHCGDEDNIKNLWARFNVLSSPPRVAAPQAPSVAPAMTPAAPTPLKGEAEESPRNDTRSSKKEKAKAASASSKTPLFPTSNAPIRSLYVSAKTLQCGGIVQMGDIYLQIPRNTRQGQSFEVRQADGTIVHLYLYAESASETEKSP